MAARSCSPVYCSKQHRSNPDYSHIDPEISSVDSGLSDSSDNEEISANPQYNSSGCKDLREKVSICWENIDVFVEMSRPSLTKRLCFGHNSHEKIKRKQVLCNVNGKVEAGTLLAVMGESGAGKSTLMNVLAHRNISQIEVRGTVKVNNCPIGSEITAISAYIQQEDLMVGSLTVKEHLTFQAFLRMGKSVSDQQRVARVNEVIHQLGLTKCADTYIGIPGRLRGISGGEKKRLSFASEVITDPPLLFADEPTSGLDSFMAESLVTALQQLAAEGRTIICTIHQPSSEVYAMFDRILLLAEARTAFLGSTADALQYFNNLGYPCPDNFNPADHFIHTLAIVPGDEENSHRRVQDICNAYSETEARENETGTAGAPDSFHDHVTLPRSQYKVSWCKQFRSVLWRSWLTNNRDSLIYRVRIYQMVFIGLVTGVFFFQVEYDQSGIQNIYGALFFMLESLSFPLIASVVFTFPEECPIFLREHHNGMYRTDVYFLTKTFAQVPQFLLAPLILVGISYWMIGLRPDPVRFFYAYGICALVAMNAASYAYVVSAASSTSSVAIALVGPLTIPLMLLGGFLVDNTTIPKWLSWLQYISWFSYSYEALLINQWDNYGNITCNASQNSTQIPCLYNGNEVIAARGFNKDNMLNDIYGLLVLIVGFRILAYLFLLWRSHKKP
ncbi:protein white-like [Montipora capricornis]|uniref:protein white-like n=1 Tax=Montipora capricornis TaxID=246305 RepID=UPI0035F1B995